jgi:hypothetical protein
MLLCIFRELLAFGWNMRGSFFFFETYSIRWLFVRVVAPVVVYCCAGWPLQGMNCLSMSAAQSLIHVRVPDYITIISYLLFFYTGTGYFALFFMLALLVKFFFDVLLYLTEVFFLFDYKIK